MTKDAKLKSAGVSGYNKPKRTPNHPTKSHIVVAKVGDKTKTIRFGQQGVKTNQTAGQRKAFHHTRQNIAKGKCPPPTGQTKSSGTRRRLFELLLWKKGRPGHACNDCMRTGLPVTCPEYYTCRSDRGFKSPPLNGDTRDHRPRRMDATCATFQGTALVYILTF